MSPEAGVDEDRIGQALTRPLQEVVEPPVSARLSLARGQARRKRTKALIAGFMLWDSTKPSDS